MENQTQRPEEAHLPPMLSEESAAQFAAETLPEELTTAGGRARVGSVLFRNHSNLGDAVVCEPAVRGVIAAFPNARTSIMISSPARSLRQLGYPGAIFPRYAKFEDVPPRRGPLLRYEVMIDATPITKQRPYYRRLSSGTHVIYPFGYRPPHFPNLSAPERMRRGLELLGIAIEDRLPALEAPDWAVAVIRSWLKATFPGDAPRPLIIVQPGSGWAAKRWMPPRFAAVADTLYERYEARIVIVTGPRDGETGERVRAAMRHADRAAFVHDWSLARVAALIQECDFFLGNDSGTAHIAAALGRPVVLIFGPTSPGVWGPSTDRALVTAPIACCHKPNECRVECLRQVTVPQALGAVEALLTDVIGRDRYPAMDAITVSDNLAALPAPEGAAQLFDREHSERLTITQGGPYLLDALAHVERHHSVRKLCEDFPDISPLLSIFFRSGIITPLSPEAS